MKGKGHATVETDDSERSDVDSMASLEIMTDLSDDGYHLELAACEFKMGSEDELL